MRIKTNYKEMYYRIKTRKVYNNFLYESIGRQKRKRSNSDRILLKRNRFDIYKYYKLSKSAQKISRNDHSDVFQEITLSNESLFKSRKVINLSVEILNERERRQNMQIKREKLRIERCFQKLRIKEKQSNI